MIRKAKTACVVSVIAVVSVWLAGPGSGQASGGPLVVMGVDAEDGGIGAHGPVAVYAALIQNILGQVANSGSNLLVIGGGKFNLPPLVDEVTAFWNAVDAALPTATVTYVNGPANIATASFAGFAMLGVVSSEVEATSGGLTAAENDALTARADDVAAFVNGGGGLLGFTQAGFANPYLYLGDIGPVTGNFGLDYSDITPTAAGLEIGVTDALDVCCWHDEFTSFPGFLQVLATNTETGVASALGGRQVIISPTTTTSTSVTTVAPPVTPTTTPATPLTATRAQAIPAQARFVG